MFTLNKVIELSNYICEKYKLLEAQSLLNVWSQLKFLDMIATIFKSNDRTFLIFLRFSENFHNFIYTKLQCFLLFEIAVLINIFFRTQF